MKQGSIVEILEDVDGYPTKYLIGVLRDSGEGFRSSVKMPSTMRNFIPIPLTVQTHLLTEIKTLRYIVVSKQTGDLLFFHYEPKRIEHILNKTGISHSDVHIRELTGEEYEFVQEIKEEIKDESTGRKMSN